MLFYVTILATGSKSSRLGFAKYELSSAASIANYHNVIEFASTILVT